MATDKNPFDDWLKIRLHRDLFFRTLIWGAVAGLTACYASSQPNFSAVEFFSRTATTLTPVLNVLGVVAILLCVPALYVKDIEALHPKWFSSRPRVSWAAGMLRRASGDLTLWVIGALVSLLAAATAGVFSEVLKHQARASDLAKVGSIYLLLFLILVVVGFLNVMVRRFDPPIVSVKNRDKWCAKTVPLTFLYGLALVALIYAAA